MATVQGMAQAIMSYAIQRQGVGASGTITLGSMLAWHDANVTATNAKVDSVSQSVSLTNQRAPRGCWGNGNHEPSANNDLARRDLHQYPK